MEVKCRNCGNIFDLKEGSIDLPNEAGNGQITIQDLIGCYSVFCHRCERCDTDATFDIGKELM